MTALGRLSIQQQNQQARTRMRAISSQFKTDSAAFGWLLDILESKSEPSQLGVLVSLKRTPDKGGNICDGIWLSAERRFVEFSVLLPYSDGPPELEFWDDVTDFVIVNEHQPGTGKSFGFLALEILDDALKS
jgi:hypothetical protein